jgi:type VI secretion system protein ImpE
MDAKSLYSAGNLADAVTASLQNVKGNPADVNARFFLAELLCFQGEWDRAEKQLDAVVKQSPDAGLLALLARQLIRGEILREQVFAEGRAPQLVGEPSPQIKLQLEICTALRNDSPAEVFRLVQEAEAIDVPLSGKCNGIDISLIRDLDDRIAGVLEVITTTGKYYWVPWQSIRSLEFSKPTRPLDLIWRKTAIDVENGPEGEVFIPTRYPLIPIRNQQEWDDALRLGRATSWVGDEDSAVTGLGQRMLLVGNETLPILELENVFIASSQ